MNLISYLTECMLLRDTILRARNYYQTMKNIMGHKLKNVFYPELLRRGGKVFVGKNNNKEVDFKPTTNENIIRLLILLMTKTFSQNIF